MSINFPQAEEEVLKRWKEINAFQTQLELSKGQKPYTFYDGPPFGTCISIKTVNFNLFANSQNGHVATGEALLVSSTPSC